MSLPAAYQSCFVVSRASATANVSAHIKAAASNARTHIPGSRMAIHPLRRP